MKYEKVIVFFTGALYAWYAIGVAVSVSTWVALIVLLPAIGIITQILTITAVMLFGAPLFYALSKIIWANLFFHYDPVRRRAASGPANARN